MSEELVIMDYLIDHIQTGKYESDDKLPSENELADLFRVPRITARKAYEKLQDLGYIYSKQGKGSFVKDRRQRIPLVMSSKESFSKKMIAQGLDYQSKNVFCEPIEYNDKIYQSFGASEQDKVYKIGRLRFIDRQPIALHISYLSESMFEEIGQVGKEITSMFEFYKEKGYTGLESRQTMLSVVYPAKYERELLACSGLIPLLVVESECVHFETGRVLEYSKIMYRGDFFTYVF